MRLKNILSAIKKKVITNIPVEFNTVTLDNGSKAMSFTTDRGEKFIIKGSIDNFERFKKWDGKKADADIQRMLSAVKTDDDIILPLAKIRTDVEVEKEPDEEENLDLEDL